MRCRFRGAYLLFWREVGIRMGFFHKKQKESKILRELRGMSDEEFLEFYKKYYLQSGVRISGGLLIVVVGIMLIVALF